MISAYPDFFISQAVLKIFPESSGILCWCGEWDPPQIYQEIIHFSLFNLGFSTYLDGSELENDMVNFNAGLHTVSIEMKARDLIEAIKPVIEDFSKILHLT